MPLRAPRYSAAPICEGGGRMKAGTRSARTAPSQTAKEATRRSARKTDLPIRADLWLAVELRADVVDDPAEFRRRHHVERPGARNRDGDPLQQSPRPRRHDEDAIGQEHRLRDRVGDEEDGLAPLEPDALQFEVQALARHRVERAEGLVHEEERGIVHEAPGDRTPLLHSARKLPRIPMLEPAEADEAEKLEGTGAVLLPAEALHVDGKQHVFQHGPPGKEHRRLEDDSYVAARSGDGRAPELDLPAARRKQPGEDLEQSRLAATRRSDESDELALPDVEVDVLEGEDRAARSRVLLAQSPHGDDAVGRVRHCPPGA